MSLYINYSGSKYNHLTLLHYVKSGGAGKGAIWSARCDCGNIRDVYARAVKHGKLKTCGKCEYTRRLIANPQISKRGRGMGIGTAHRKLFGRYTHSAKTRGHPWALSMEQFIDITNKSCFYCGEAPSQRVRTSKLLYNGIDRLENEQGYTLDNCIPCCGTCIRMKHTLNYKEFLGKVMKIYWEIKDTLDTKASM